MFKKLIEKILVDKVAERLIDPASKYLTADEMNQQFPDSINRMELKYTYHADRVNFCYHCGKFLKLELTDHKSFDMKTGKRVRVFYKVCPIHHHKVEEASNYDTLCLR